MSSAVRETGKAIEAGRQPPSGGFCLPEMMRVELEGGPKLPRSESTRRRMLIAAAELMLEAGFNELKVGDICKRAGFAHGTFYLHWPDRKAVAHEVLKGFMQAIRSCRPPRRDGQTLFQRLVEGHAYYIEVYRRNIGLMQCQGQLADQMAEFAEIGLQANRGLARRVVRAVERELGMPLSAGPESDGDPERLATAFCCIAMVDKILHEVFARKLRIGLDDQALAVSLSRTWYRALLGRDPE